ncbi:MAG: prepilin-type N-terminal cleavage/methylation domain-containing protein [Pseudomonadota bacterium]|nr:prepilin-type N-terminal cleavage/methylation domain-containing protein [Pseudomonadota bacterium]
MSLTLVDSHPLAPEKEAELAGGNPAPHGVVATLADVHRCAPPRRATLGGRAPFAGRPRGFTLIELLVAIAAMALMAGLSWRGLDGMVRAQTQTQQRADAVLTLQAGLGQWSADLDALLALPQTQTLDWDGRGLRIIRRSSAAPGAGLLVVAWARRNINGADQWLRWQSPPQFTRGELQATWERAAQWAQNPGDEEKKYEVRIAALEQWQIFYFRGNAWSNPLSSDNATPAAGSAAAGAAADLTLPDGVRLVLTLPPGQAISGNLIVDWVQPALDGGKS